jgi:hypothetical protein
VVYCVVACLHVFYCVGFEISTLCCRRLFLLLNSNLPACTFNVSFSSLSNVRPVRFSMLFHPHVAVPVNARRFYTSNINSMQDS